jgi:NADH dehydrogenase [ubiquinone] 1 alpha subcomplex assembly factor 1
MNFLSIILTAIIMNNSLQQIEDNILLNSSIMQTENKWRIVNDGVMGGLSSSKVFVDGDSKIIFSGNVSLENNGGFASLRSPVKDYNFEKFAGLEIKLKGDGKRYSFSMKETTYFKGYFYTSSFETKKDEWIVVQIPFNQFKLYYYGKETSSNKKIPLNNIKEISLLIGDKQEGNLITEVDYILLY